MAAIILSADFGIANNTQRENTIDINKIQRSRLRSCAGLINPAQEEITFDLADEHAAEPIKDINDIRRICTYLIGNGRYRDYMMFIIGINFGLRISDLLQLRFAHLIDEDFNFKTVFSILEKKTKNTRKVRKNRYIYINGAVMDAVLLYLRHNTCKLDDYLFKSESNNGSNTNKPMLRQSADKILKRIGEELKLPCKIATHSLRKTFAYHQMVMSNNDPRKLLLLQKMFGHSSAAQTLDYIGITNEEIEEAYMNLNLGSYDSYIMRCDIGEGAAPSVS